MKKCLVFMFINRKTRRTDSRNYPFLFYLSFPITIPIPLLDEINMLYFASFFCRLSEKKKQTNKQTSEQTNKETNKYINKWKKVKKMTKIFFFLGRLVPGAIFGMILRN